MNSSQWLKALPLLLFLLVSISLGMGLFNSKPPPPQIVGKEIAYLNLPMLGKPGVILHPGIWRGQVVVLNFFASWCAPCKQEHPLLMKLAAMGRAPIYGIAWRDDGAKTAQWLTAAGNPYKAIGDDRRGSSTVAFALTGVPETFVIDKNNVIQLHIHGPLTEDVLQNTVIPLIDRLNAMPEALPQTAPAQPLGMR